jgi:hypothetical protein
MIVTAEAESGGLLFPRLSSPVIAPAVPEAAEGQAADLFGRMTNAERGLLAEKIHNASVGADAPVRAELSAVVDDILAPPAVQTEEQELAAWCAEHGVDYGVSYESGKKQYLVGGEALWPGEARARFMPERARRWREANEVAAELDRGVDAEAGQ